MVAYNLPHLQQYSLYGQQLGVVPYPVPNTLQGAAQPEMGAPSFPAGNYSVQPQSDPSWAPQMPGSKQIDIVD